MKLIFCGCSCLLLIIICNRLYQNSSFYFEKDHTSYKCCLIFWVVTLSSRRVQLFLNFSYPKIFSKQRRTCFNNIYQSIWYSTEFCWSPSMIDFSLFHTGLNMPPLSYGSIITARSISSLCLVVLGSETHRLQRPTFNIRSQPKDFYRNIAHCKSICISDVVVIFETEQLCQ